MKTYIWIIVLLTLPLSKLMAQQDTMKNYNLPNFIVEAQKDPEYEKRYQKLVRDVKKALPYAKMAGFRFQIMEQNLQTLPTEKARKEYLKRTEEAIKEQFMDDLVNMTVSQGKILIKLIHRETGKDTYTLLKEYRGGFTALYWQGLARVFSADLKNEYNPVEDWQMEQIIKTLGFE
ncbi:MAG: DUF4294 domain-containing protein [Bacteroidota bacterium]